MAVSTDFFAQVPESVVTGLQCAECCRLYAYLDLRQGNGSWAVLGVRKIADGLGWQHRTTKKHLEHMAEVGLIAFDVDPKRAWSNVRISVQHNPARKRNGKLLEVPGVFTHDVPERWRSPSSERSVLDELETHRQNAERNAPTVEARRALPQGATCPLGTTDALHDAPSVPGYKAMSRGFVVEEAEEGALQGPVRDVSSDNASLCPELSVPSSLPDQLLCRLDCGRPADSVEHQRYCKSCEPF